MIYRIWGWTSLQSLIRISSKELTYLNYMNVRDRRRFIQTLGLGISLPHISLTTPLELDQRVAVNLESRSNDHSESFWKLVKSQFSFAPQLRYFNNASLGASPLSVQQATIAARNTLDAFPSKYMWGGWDEEKEAVRQFESR